MCPDRAGEHEVERGAENGEIKLLSRGKLWLGTIEQTRLENVLDAGLQHFLIGLDAEVTPWLEEVEQPVACAEGATADVEYLGRRLGPFLEQYFKLQAADLVEVFDRATYKNLGGEALCPLLHFGRSLSAPMSRHATMLYHKRMGVLGNDRPARSQTARSPAPPGIIVAWAMMTSSPRTEAR